MRRVPFTGFVLVMLIACSDRNGEVASLPPDASTDVEAGPCGETPGHTPTPSEGDPCTTAGLVCGPYRCDGDSFHRIERCLTSPSQIGEPCRVAPGYPCTLRDHCGGLPGDSMYRGYECIDGRWVDVTSTPCADAG